MLFCNSIFAGEDIEEYDTDLSGFEIALSPLLPGIVVDAYYKNIFLDVGLYAFGAGSGYFTMGAYRGGYLFNLFDTRRVGKDNGWSILLGPAAGITRFRTEGSDEGLCGKYIFMTIDAKASFIYWFNRNHAITFKLTAGVGITLHQEVYSYHELPGRGDKLSEVFPEISTPFSIGYSYRF